MQKRAWGENHLMQLQVAAMETPTPGLTKHHLRDGWVRGGDELAAPPLFFSLLAWSGVGTYDLCFTWFASEIWPASPNSGL